VSNNDLEKKMVFILEQQERFAADSVRLKDALISVVGIVGKLATAQEKTNAEIAELVAAQRRTDGTVAELTAVQKHSDAETATLRQHTEAELAAARKHADSKFAELAEAQTRTEASLSELAERLDIFINVVERHISGNGDKGPANR